uniref:Carboxylic ester hydrolase n=1 Tax=Echeneis naucrates TaxID=173247 RepID=A0A665VP85_ECHNA
MLSIVVDLPDVSEDCLYLNIYTPANRARDAKLPVMVWIHGGGFTLGSASTYDGSVLAAYQDVVVVLIQYRLGFLGFLSTSDEHLPGNFGLLDQVEALRWIQQHIHSFGGNPDLVTIFGESAGGVSVSLLLLSPLSDGLIHHAIAESGTSAMDSLVVNDSLPMTQVSYQCAFDPNLRTVVNTDGHFLRKPVAELFHAHEVNTIPFMTGVNNDEGGWLLNNMNILAPVTTVWKSEMGGLNFWEMCYLPFQPLRQLMPTEVFHNTELCKDILMSLYLILLSHIFINTSHIGLLPDAGAPVYLYEYQHPPSFLLAKRPSFVQSDHGDEIFTVFGLCFTNDQIILKEECTEEEKLLSKTVMSYWGNFARTGSPNGDGLVHWPKYGAEESYLKIGLKESVPSQYLKKQRFVFFTQTLPEKLQQHKEKMEHSELSLLYLFFLLLFFTF